MPGYDRTGPRGEGPRTGGGFGRCGGREDTGGWGRGGGRGRGRGRGNGRGRSDDALLDRIDALEAELRALKGAKEDA